MRRTLSCDWLVGRVTRIWAKFTNCTFGPGLMPRSSKSKHRAQFPVYKASVEAFFSDKKKWMTVYPYINGDRFSRRFFEHFITEYARSHPCTYYITRESGRELFNVYHSAQSVLLGVHKRHMDPFGRRNRDAENDGIFEFGHGDKVCKVTVGEMLFFRWALVNKVLEYAEEHHEEIREDMAKMARVKRETPSRSVEEVVIEVPSMALAPVHPLQDAYWQASTAEKMQQPKKRRKRYRESAVDTVFNNDVEIKTEFS